MPPANLDAERFVLGSILIGGVEFASVQRSLAANDFSLEKHRRIFARILDLHARGEHIDRLTLAEELGCKNELDAVDGLSYLVSLDDGISTSRTSMLISAS
jgi:replicative DNA helicase